MPVFGAVGFDAALWERAIVSGPRLRVSRGSREIPISVSAFWSASRDQSGAPPHTMWRGKHRGYRYRDFVELQALPTGECAPSRSRPPQPRGFSGVLAQRTPARCLFSSDRTGQPTGHRPALQGPASTTGHRRSTRCSDRGPFRPDSRNESPSEPISRTRKSYQARAARKGDPRFFFSTAFRTPASDCGPRGACHFDSWGVPVPGCDGAPRNPGPVSESGCAFRALCTSERRQLLAVPLRRHRWAWRSRDQHAEDALRPR